MNDEAVYRTAPATPGLLITWKGDRQIDIYVYKLTWQLYERIGLRADSMKKENFCLLWLFKMKL